MFKIKSATRLALTLGIGCASLVWMSIGIGMIPNPFQLDIEKRIALTKAMSVNVATFAESKRTSELETILQRTLEAEESLLSLGVTRRGKNSYYIVCGPHPESWNSSDQIRDRQIEVEILANSKPWGTLQVAYKPTTTANMIGMLAFPFGLVLFVGASMTLMTWAVLAKTFRYLNPSKVVPDRVKSALDTLAEGLVLISPDGEIAHANQAFTAIVQCDESDFLGGQLADFDWSDPDDSPSYSFPWDVCQTKKSRICGEVVQLRTNNQPVRKFVVNASPIYGPNETVRGALISFDDVTSIENKNAELGKMIHTLRSSRDEIERQNEKLSFLASFDPLTKCLNRRAFFGQFENHWEQAADGRLAIMMLDVDHFKAVNDNHGHSVGDDVLRGMGDLLHREVGDCGLVCRYGGEEFVVLVPDVEFDRAMELAEQIRSEIEADSSTAVRFTVSIGVSGRAFGSMDPQHMLDQADESLYIAKRHGRNQVVRFDERGNFAEAEESDEDIAQQIPYSAVTGLLSALSFRCADTAKHSLRVADLCVAIGERMMNSRDVYRLEVAALLHEIGKIGVPDSILKKPGPLTDEEWTIMRQHDQIGVEIVRSAFGSDRVAGFIESHHYCFSARKSDGDLSLANETIPLAGRIISVCDAFDSMTSDHVYRTALPELEALEEIVRNTPQQFDTEVVKVLVTHLQEGHLARQSQQQVESLVPSVCPEIESHIENLYAAIGDKDVDRLKAVVDDLKRDAGSVEVVSDVTQRLDDAMSEEVGMEKVLMLAKEVMDVCRSNRFDGILTENETNEIV